MKNCVPRLLGPVPAAITIHRKIAADDCDDLRAAFRQRVLAFPQNVCSTSRRRIPSVSKRMNKNLLYSGSMRRFRQRQEMTIMTVHASF